MKHSLNNLNLLCGILLTTMLSINAIEAQKNNPELSLEGKKIICVSGGWAGHKPTESAAFFVPKLRAEGAVVDVYNTLDVYTDKNLMNKADLIIQMWTFGEITKEQFNGLRNAVHNGTGFSGWHGGIGDSFRGNIEYQFMVGGQFLFHPGGKIDHQIKIYDKKDPITKGIKDFELKKTEQYYMLVDPNVKVLAISEFTRATYQKKAANAIHNQITGSTMPVVWKKNYGKGRVFYSSIGHYLTDFEVPEVLEMQLRGFRWAAQGKYMKHENTISPVYKK